MLGEAPCAAIPGLVGGDYMLGAAEALGLYAGSWARGAICGSVTALRPIHRSRLVAITGRIHRRRPGHCLIVAAAAAHCMQTAANRASAGDQRPPVGHRPGTSGRQSGTGRPDRAAPAARIYGPVGRTGGPEAPRAADAAMYSPRINQRL